MTNTENPGKTELVNDRKHARQTNPCQGICVILEGDGFCIGCGRTEDERENWFDLTNEEREVVLEQLDTRLEQIQE
jgi:predicted Fe-S protein YdhL (DUF1289 family)